MVVPPINLETNSYSTGPTSPNLVLICVPSHWGADECNVIRVMTKRHTTIPSSFFILVVYSFMPENPQSKLHEINIFLTFSQIRSINLQAQELNLKFIPSQNLQFCLIPRSSAMMTAAFSPIAIAVL